VGQKAPRFFWRKDSLIIQDGVSFNLLEDGQPFITFYLRNLTAKEADHISVRPIESAYWHNSGFWLGVLKIGEMLQQLAFDPMVHLLNYQCFSSDLFQGNRPVIFVGIDTADMTVKALRATTYPWKFLKSLEEAFGGFWPRTGYSWAYDRVIREFDRLPLPQLWERFIPGGYFGEKRTKE
jgi:hypothetical protein